MKILMCLVLIAGSSLAFPQYGTNVQTDIEVVPQVEEISQKEVVPDFPEQSKQSENLEHPKHPGDSAQDVHPEQTKIPENVENPELSDFDKEQKEKLTKYWWKVSGIFSGSDKDIPSDIEPGLGVGGPFTPQQSKFCEVGFDCVPGEICVDGHIALHGQTVLQQRIKPTNYETNQCGQEGNVCCGIPEDILAAHQENVGTIDIIEDKVETLPLPVPPETHVDPISSNVEYDPSSPLETGKVREEGQIDTLIPVKPVAPVDSYEPIEPFKPHEPIAPIEPHKPLAPVDPNEPLAPVDPHKPLAPVDPNESLEPVDPHKPLAPVDPNEPLKPVDPHKPLTPVDPYEPLAPVDPHEPLAPVDPYDPLAPVKPLEPLAPVDPNEPLAPVDPNKPLAPVDPYDPLAPVKPLEPLAPVVVDTDIQSDQDGNFDISINAEIPSDHIDGAHESSVHKPPHIKSETIAAGEYDPIGTGVDESQISPGHSSTVIKSDTAIGEHGHPAGDNPLKDPAGHDKTSPLVGEDKVENIGALDACGHASYECVPYFQCVNGVISLDGTGIIDVRIKPQGVCTHPNFPNVPGVCCLIPGYDPTPSPNSQCPNHQDCVPQNLCSSEGENIGDGRGQLDLRTGHKKCQEASGEVGVCCNRHVIPGEECPQKSVCVSKLECFGQALSAANEFIDYANTGRWTHCSKYSDGVCCKQPERIILDVCPGDSQCVGEEYCSGQALDGNKKFVDYISGGSGGTWSHCSVGNVNGICCSPPKSDVSEVCPGKSQCVLAGQCSGQAIDGSGNIVKYPSNGLWHQCSLGNSNGICCIPTEALILDTCPEKSLCLSADQCFGQALDGSGKFIDYVSSGSWSYCSLGNANGVCCLPPAPVIRETCPEGSKCVIGNQCSGQALDGNGNFIDYVSSGSWSYCSLNPENGICCKALPSRVIDVCPLQSVCLRPEQCIGKAMSDANNFVDYSKDGTWIHCSEYEGGVCCQNPQTPKDPGHLTPAPLCGIRNYNIDERITSSKIPNEAAFGEFPWQSIIFYQNFTFVCGATLVSNKFVLTAAHCVDGIQPQDIKIRFGEWMVSSIEEPLSYVDRNVYKIHIHPDFNAKNVHKDFAVIELQEPVEFQYHINSVCIPKQGYMVKPYSQCFTTGWGKDSFEGSFQSTLKKIDLPFIEHEKCQSLLRTTPLGKYFRLDHSFNCAGGEENKDACYGDGGGPLVCKDKASSQYHLIGITSWGIGCGKKNIPGVYANVPEYSNWINSIFQLQDKDLPQQYKESLEPFVEESVQEHGHDLQQKEELQIEDIPEQVKQEPHQEEGHIESIPDPPAPAYGK